MSGRVVGRLACQRDTYLQALDTEVVSCIELSSQKTDPPKAKSKPKTDAAPQWLIEFADSVLFPEGGGQPSDHGTVVPLQDPSPEPIPITFVQRQGLRCVYHSPKSLPPGMPVRQEIDFRRRWDHMQQHTGQHLLSAIMDKYDNLNTLGWGMGGGSDMSYVDLPRKPSDQEMQTIQEQCNDAIKQNIQITVDTPDGDNTDKLPADYDKEKGLVRIVKIGDLDRNACCGTHFRQTSHVSLLLLGMTQPVKSTRHRLSFIAGERAINLATSSIHSIRDIARLMSSTNTPAEVLLNVSKMKNNVADLKKKETKLLADIATYEVNRVRAAMSSGGNAFVYRAEPGVDFINMVTAQLKDDMHKDSTIILASGEASKGGQVVIVGGEKSVEEFAGKVKEAISGVKGGGRGTRWQGKVMEWRNGDLEALEKLTIS